MDGIKGELDAIKSHYEMQRDSGGSDVTSAVILGQLYVAARKELKGAFCPLAEGSFAHVVEDRTQRANALHGYLNFIYVESKNLGVADGFCEQVHMDIQSLETILKKNQP